MQCRRRRRRMQGGKIMVRKLSSVLFAILFLSIIFSGGAWAATLVTHCVSNATELQNALNTAAGNTAPDLIKVVQGTYSGNFFFNSSEGYSITLRGGYVAGCGSRVLNPANTVLDGGGTGKTLVFDNSQGGDVTVEGFTIRNGHGLGSGGGLAAYSSSPLGSADNVTISSNIITDNTSGQIGAGINAHSMGETGTGTITITGNTITDNIAATEGGGMHVESGTNTGTVGTVTITNNTVTGNSGRSGGGVYVYSSSDSGISGNISLSGNTISGNSADDWGGGALIDSTGAIGSGNLTVQGNTLTDNTADGRSGRCCGQR